MAGSETSLTRSSNRIDYDSLQADKTRDSKDLWSTRTNEMRNAVDMKDRQKDNRKVTTNTNTRETLFHVTNAYK